MKGRDILITNYINSIREEFEKKYKSIPDEVVSQLIKQYLNSSKSFNEIKEEIDKLVVEKFTQLKNRELLMKNATQNTKGITDLNVEVKGITLNMQQIDLLSIVSINEENLYSVLSGIHNLTDEQKQSILSSGKDLNMLKRDLFKMYQDSLINYEDVNLDESGEAFELNKRISFVLSNSALTQKQKKDLEYIIRNNQLSEIPKLIKETLGSDASDRIFKTLVRYMPTEKSGIKSASYESFERLAEHLSDYQVINLDDIAKYGHYVRADGKFNSDDLVKALDFARSYGMQTRLNTLLFYMDTPKILENMSVERGKTLAKELLESYVENITSVIAKYNEDCIKRQEQPTVRTVEIFNELLNRFSKDGSIPYEYRGDIDVDENRLDIDNPDYDNLRAGWLRFFKIEELCEIMKIARNNLPDVNFMINECTLEDPKKVEPFKTLILDKIHDYEQQHGIKLIDSIGTQMHIDSSISEDDMRIMFEKLLQFGLPVEVTEFDVSLDLNFINSHSQAEIENLKRKKINDFCNVVIDMQKKGNISGVTIWSVSDNQNFVVDIVNQNIYRKNLERKTQGLEPIPYVNSLYGGYYNSEMEDITKAKKNNLRQDFNYHTHTYRSGHSEYASDEEVLQAARNANLSMVGFSEHIPNHPLLVPNEDKRMLFSEVDDYISSINKLKKDNLDITILAGFEAEFDPMKETFLGEMRDKVDYMILGQHFIPNGLEKVRADHNPNFPIEYAKMIGKAIDSGIFDIVAHPDYFMKYRDTMVSQEDKELFDKNAVIASSIICGKARDMGIPLEINLSPALNNQILSDGSFAYPHPLFWNVAKSFQGLRVLKGIDAHHLAAFKEAPQAEVLISNIEEMVSDKLIQGGYNPAIERQNNKKLCEAYEIHQEKALTFETQIIDKLVNSTLNKDEEVADLNEMTSSISNSLDAVMHSLTNGVMGKYQTIENEIMEIINSDDMPSKDRIGNLERKKQAMKETKKTLDNQHELINNTKNNVEIAKNMGCESKEEFSSLLTQMTQSQSTRNNNQRLSIEMNIGNFHQVKSEERVNNQSKSEVKKLVKTNNNQENNHGNSQSSNNTNSNTSQGFTNSMLLSFILILITSFVLIIVSMIYK